MFVVQLDAVVHLSAWVGEGNSCSQIVNLDYFRLVLMKKTHRVVVTGLIE